MKKWVPEVAKLPKKFMHQPWLAPRDAQTAAGFELGKTYPQRITGNADLKVLTFNDDLPSEPRERMLQT